MPLAYTRLTHNSIQFDIESLTPPKALLEESTLQTIAEQLCPDLEALQEGDRLVVNGGNHAFLWGLHRAYAEHRPFTLSPDMIWLLVLQGVAQHINYSAAKGNHLFDAVQSRQTIVVFNQAIKLGDPSSPWEETTTQLTEAVAKALQNDQALIDLLRADFSTTQLAERVASEITILDAMKPYFEYIVARCICGIPSMTLEGTVEDWDRMLHKLHALQQYDLAWWVDELVPIVQDIRSSAEGNPSKDFWMNIFKVHTEDGYGAPKTVDGWITTFFPYDNKGNRRPLRERRAIFIDDLLETLPHQLVQVPFRFQLRGPDGIEVLSDTPMAYWAGFVGVEQDPETFGLRPLIHWWVARDTSTLSCKGDEEAKWADGKAYYQLEEVPEEVFESFEERKPPSFWDKLKGTEGKPIGDQSPSGLYLNFKGPINIPDRLGKLNIRWLDINGQASPDLAQRLKKLFEGHAMTIQLNGVYVKE